MATLLRDPALSSSPLLAAIEAAEKALLARQQSDGHWVFELEADCTIPSEYVLFEHYLDEIDDALEAKLAAYLRRIQNPDGGWPLLHRGDSDVSATVKAYYALKLVGDSVDALHMRRARERVLAFGGAARCNVFTRIALALFEQVPWRATPAMPIELLFAPRWFPFHVEKISYWSRTVLTPLLVLCALRPRARNPRGVGIAELFITPPNEERHYLRPATPTPTARFFLLVDSIVRVFERLSPPPLRKAAIAKAMRFLSLRLNGDDGLGGIFPAMVNALFALVAVGRGPNDAERVTAKRALQKLVAEHDGEAYVQPCFSPVWDTALAIHALFESAGPAANAAIARGNAWLSGRQILEVAGDWAAVRPKVRPGGWAFQYWNDYYPDVDDTGVVAMTLDREDRGAHAQALERAAEWIVGMQSKGGGWGAFDADNTHYHLDHIPFADHGALLDPPTEDVTARCVGFLLQYGYPKSDPTVASGLEYLHRTQQDDGSWFGRWGTNYIYGTWSVLNALAVAGENAENSRVVARAVEYLRGFQQPDGGWGEDGGTYWTEKRGLCKESTPSQTAWALLGLMAAGVTDDPALERGVRFLLDTQNAEGVWDEECYTAVGFPRVFYLRYHGYRTFFPLMALARYRNIVKGTERPGEFGF